MALLYVFITFPPIEVVNDLFMKPFLLNCYCDEMGKMFRHKFHSFGLAEVFNFPGLWQYIEEAFSNCKGIDVKMITKSHHEIDGQQWYNLCDHSFIICQENNMKTINFVWMSCYLCWN